MKENMKEAYKKLYQNICDTVKEWEIKIGYRKEEIQLYYPEESLLELLDTNKESLNGILEKFCVALKECMGDLMIYETEEKGRYCVRIPAQGVSYVHDNFPESAFLKAFLKVVTIPGKHLEDMCQVFYDFSSEVTIEKVEEREWGIWFTKGDVDSYVYYVEEDEFGLEYHRFTQEAYQKLISA